MTSLGFISRVVQGMFRPDHPSYLVFFVTSRCNCNCSFCFNRKNVVSEQKPLELTLDQIEQVAGSLNPLPQLLLSGGEPFLRKDLAGIVRAFYNLASTRQISIPTNGTLPERILSGVKNILDSCPKVFLNINISLDAFGPEHDAVRGFAGCFQRICRTFSLLEDLRPKYPGLSVNVLSVVGRHIAPDLPKFMSQVKQSFHPDYHMLEFDRTRAGSEESCFDISGAMDTIEDTYTQSGMFRKFPITPWLVPSLALLVWRIMRRAEVKDSRCFHCLAGRKMVVMTPEGLLYPCEPLWLDPAVRQGIEDSFFCYGNVSNYGFDVPAMLSTKKALTVKAFIKSEKCACAYGCAVLNSIMYRPWKYAGMARKIMFRKHAQAPRGPGIRK